MAEIDPSIILNRGGGGQSLDLAEAARLGQQMGLARQNQQMLMQQRQQEALAQQAAMSRQQQLQGLLGQGGTPQEMASRLIGGGHLDEGMKLGKYGEEQAASGLNRQKQELGIIGESARQLYASPTYATGQGIVNNLRRMGINADQFESQLFEHRDNPKELQKIAAGYDMQIKDMLPKLGILETGSAIQDRSINPVTNEIQVLGETPVQLTPGQIQQGQIAREGNQIQRRGQDIQAETARLGREAAVNKETAKDTSPAEKRLPIQQAISTLDRLVAHPGSRKALGSASLFPTIPGSEAADFESQLDTFKSQAFLQSISQMKGMGALSNAEGEKLASAVGALSLKQGKKAFDSSVDRIKKEMIEKYEAHTGQKFEQKKEETGIPHVERLLDKYRD